jgi:hypothetical protein
MTLFTASVSAHGDRVTPLEELNRRRWGSLGPISSHGACTLR